MSSTKNPRQIDKIIGLMKDGNPRTLGQIVEGIGGISEAGASARLRDIRRAGWEVRKHRIGPHFWSYSIHRIDPQEKLFA